MKVIVSYLTTETKIIEMTPEEYCHYHADSSKLFPINSYNHEFYPATAEDEEELDSFLWIKETERKVT